MSNLIHDIQKKVFHLPARNSSLNPPKICCIDGNIGAGKSTVLNELKSRGYLVFEEDLDNWGTLLEKCYSDPKRWMCSLQIKILHSMRNQFEIISEHDNLYHKFIFIERSPLSSMIFVENGFLNGNLDSEELDLICQVYKNLFWNPDISLYIETSVEECFKRKIKRNRKCESGVSKNYLQYLHEKYVELYKKSDKCFIIDGQSKTSKIVDDIILFLKNN
jgi:deoxyadenosine/deoxycytidine kinase